MLPGDGSTVGCGRALINKPINSISYDTSIPLPPVAHPVPPTTPLVLRRSAAISLVGQMTMTLSVSPEFPAKSLRELIDHARAYPGKLNYASVGAQDALLAGLMMKATGSTMTRVIYKGPVQSMQDLLAGRIDVAINPIGAQIALARDGRLRILAVLRPNREADAPDVPTTAEAGLPEFGRRMWYGLFGPANLSSAPTRARSCNSAG